MTTASSSAFMSSGFLAGTARVLLVGADENQSAMICEKLSGEMFELVRCPDADRAVEQMRSEWIDALIILWDVNLERMRLLCRELRREPDIWMLPVIVFAPTASGAELSRWLAVGADDVVVSPISRSLLAARIQSLLRRLAAMNLSYRERRRNSVVLRVGRIVMRPDRHEVFVDGRLVDMPLAEYRLLQLLMNRPYKVLNREQLMQMLHGQAGEVTERSIDSRVSLLRRHLGTAGDHIRTIRSIGYQLIDPDHAARGHLTEK